MRPPSASHFAKTLRSLGVLCTLAAFLCVQVSPRVAFAEPARTALLGLDAADSNLGRQVSDALADSLEARNALFRAPLTFAEYRLMMSCAPDNNRCLGRAGDGFDAPQLLLGGIELSGSEIEVRLRLLRNRSGALLASSRFTFKSEQLQGEKLVTSADYMVNNLFAKASGDAPPPFPFTAAAEGSQGEPSPAEDSPLDQQEKEPQSVEAEEDPSGLNTPHPSTKELEQERQDRQVRKPNKKRVRGLGKKIALGVTAGLSLASFGTAIWTSLYLRKNGPLHKEIIRIGQKSVSGTDGDPDNNVDPFQRSNLCEKAREPRKDGSGIRNKDIDAACTHGEKLVVVNGAAVIAGGVLATTAAVLLTLIIKERRSAKQKRLSLGGSWVPGSRMSISSRWRF